MEFQKKELITTLGKFYQKPEVKVSFEFFLSLLTIIVFAVFAIRPTILTISDLIKEIEDKQVLEEQLQKKISALSTAQDEYQILQDQIVYLDQAIPSQPELITSLKVIEKIASDNKVIISNLRTSNIPAEQEPQNIYAGDLARIDLYISLLVVGDYPSIRSFVSDLHNYRRAFVVEEVNFHIDERIVMETLRANMSIRTPYFGDK